MDQTSLGIHVSSNLFLRITDHTPPGERGQLLDHSISDLRIISGQKIGLCELERRLLDGLTAIFLIQRLSFLGRLDIDGKAVLLGLFKAPVHEQRCRSLPAVLGPREHDVQNWFCISKAHNPLKLFHRLTCVRVVGVLGRSAKKVVQKLGCDSTRGSFWPPVSWHGPKVVVWFPLGVDAPSGASDGFAGGFIDHLEPGTGWICLVPLLESITALPHGRFMCSGIVRLPVASEQCPKWASGVREGVVERSP